MPSRRHPRAPERGGVARVSFYVGRIASFANFQLDRVRRGGAAAGGRLHQAGGFQCLFDDRLHACRLAGRGDRRGVLLELLRGPGARSALRCGQRGGGAAGLDGGVRRGGSPRRSGRRNRRCGRWNRARRRAYARPARAGLSPRRCRGGGGRRDPCRRSRTVRSARGPRHRSRRCGGGGRWARRWRARPPARGYGAIARRRPRRLVATTVLSLSPCHTEMRGQGPA